MTDFLYTIVAKSKHYKEGLSDSDKMIHFDLVCITALTRL